MPTSAKNHGKKPRQHHVWQQYLRAWSEDNRVYCLQDGRIFRTGTPVLGVDTNFYKVPSLTDEDLALLRLIVGLENVHPAAREHHETVLQRILTPTLFVTANRGRLRNLDQVEELLDAYNTNVVDDYHTGTEGTFVPLLERSLAGDIGWYDSAPDCIDFCVFVGQQVMRTRGVKERTITRVRERMGLDVSRIWNILALIFGFNIGCSLFLERKARRLVLVHNQTTTPFITSDQPATDLTASRDTPPEILSLYFPISPQLAFHLGEPGVANVIPIDSITDHTVMSLNQRIAQASHSQIYARTREPLVAERNTHDR